MNAADRILRNPFVALAPTDDGYLAYDVESSRLHRLNPTAALIIELADGTHTAEQLIDALVPHIAEHGREGCVQWMETAVAEGLLKPLPPGAVVPAEPPPEHFASQASGLRSDGHVLAAFVCQHYATYLLPDEADQWAALGELAHIVGRREDAREAWERYTELEPGDAEVEQILVSLRDEPPPPRAPDSCIVQLYERFAEFYERNMCTDLEYQAPLQLAEALEAELGDACGLDVLELGCGTGLAGQHLRRRARRLVGIDLSPDMVAHAEATHVYDALEVAEITEWLTRADATQFDLIAACDTMIYFGDLRQVLVPASKRIRAGGTFALTVERGEGAPFRLTDSGRYVHAESHIRDAARDAGFTVASVGEHVIRYEYGAAVVGLVAVLRRS